MKYFTRFPYLFTRKPSGSSEQLIDLVTQHIKLLVMTSTDSYHRQLSNNRCHTEE
jgi:hypothetical protein